MKSFIETEYFRSKFNMKGRRISNPRLWPCNDREWLLEQVHNAIVGFAYNQNVETETHLITLVNDYDFNLCCNIGRVRVTKYEVQLISEIYYIAKTYCLFSVVAFLYEIVAETTHMHRMVRLSRKMIFKHTRIEPKTSIIRPYKDLPHSLQMYQLMYSSSIWDYAPSFSAYMIEFMSRILGGDIPLGLYQYQVLNFVTILCDLSFMRGTPKEVINHFERKELLDLFRYEADLLAKAKLNPLVRPLKGMLMLQIGNYILKSRNGYYVGAVYRCLHENDAAKSWENGQIWMKRIELLNDKRERKVLPELFKDTSWVGFDWVRDLDFTPIRQYYVTSFSKCRPNQDMLDEYGKCVYGFKGDAIADLIAPLEKRTWERCGQSESNEPLEFSDCIQSQVVVMDVLYDIDKAKEELKLLCSIVDSFQISSADKKKFLEEILQYWLLSIKDPKWEHEQERRYTVFKHEASEYEGLEGDETFLKIKTSLFKNPDFVLGSNPNFEKLKQNAERDIQTRSTKSCRFCRDCLNRDYTIWGENIEVCPICGSRNVEVVTPTVHAW